MLPDIPKPLPAIKDNQTGKVKCDLFLILPPWFATFLNTKFADKEELCQGLLCANYFNSASLIQLLSCGVAARLIEDSQYLGT